MIAPVTSHVVVDSMVSVASGSTASSEEARLDVSSFVELTGDSVHVLDAEIDDAVRSARSETTDAQRISSQISVLQAIEGALEQAKKKDDDVVAAKDLVVTTAGGAVSARALLDQAGITMPDSVSLRAVKTKVDELQSTRSAITQGQELRQLRLQELLGQRAHLLEQTSNLLRSLHDTLKSLIGNLR